MVLYQKLITGDADQNKVKGNKKNNIFVLTFKLIIKIKKWQEGLF